VTDTLTRPEPITLPPPANRPERRWLVLGVLALAQLMVALDITVVNIALPVAQHALHFSNGDRQWIVTAYSLAFGSLLLLGGRLSDFIGRRRALVIGIVGFALGSALGGAAHTYTLLVAARAMQGLFGALLAPAALASVSTTFTDPGERGKAFGIYGAVAGAGAGVGLLLGGFLTQYASWRWCLYINVPIAILAATGALLFMRSGTRSARVRLDLPGSLTVTAGLVAIVYGFSHAATSGWADPLTIGILIAGAALIAIFVAIERRVEHPLLPLRVVLNRHRGGAYTAFGLLGIGMFGVFLFLTYYMEGIVGFSPVMTGVAFLPMVGALLVSATAATAVLARRLSNRALMTGGMAIAAAGIAWLTQIGVHTAYATHVLPALLIVGVGFGLVFSPGMEMVTDDVRAHDAGVASAMMNVTQQVGGSIGTALLNTVVATAAASFMAHKAFTPALVPAATVHSFTVAFWIVTGIFAAGALVTGLLLPRRANGAPAVRPARPGRWARRSASSAGRVAADDLDVGVRVGRSGSRGPGRPASGWCRWAPSRCWRPAGRCSRAVG
jgi:EmrB/QacA subfamily drug resistance transporter